MGIAWAVAHGDLRLGREVTTRDAAIAKLEAAIEKLVTKGEQVLIAEQEATRTELTELRKTNAELVATISRKEII